MNPENRDRLTVDQIITRLFFLSIGLGAGLAGLYLFRLLAWDGFVWSVVCCGISSLLCSVVAIPRLIDKYSERVQIPEHLEDEARDLQSGQLTRGIVMGLVFIVVLVIYFWQILSRDKIANAYWGDLPVLVPTILLSGLMFLVAGRTSWHSDNSYRTPGWAFWGPTAVACLSMLLGVYYTEPVYEGMTQAQVDQIKHSDEAHHGYHYGYTRVYSYHTWWETSTTPSAAAPTSSAGAKTVPLKCSGKSCSGIGLLLLAVVVIALMLIVLIASAVIAHFWVLGTVLMLMIMYLVLAHELRRDRRAWNW